MADESIAARIRALGAETIAQMTMREIAERVGCTRIHVWHVLRQAGLTPKPGKKGPPDTGRRDSVRPYLDAGLSWIEVAERLGITPAAVRCAVFRIRHKEGRTDGR